MENYKIIPESVLKQIVKTNCQSNYMVQVLTHLCIAKDITAFLTVEEVCDVVDISPEQLNQARRTNKIKAIRLGGTFVYSPYEIVLLAEQIHRRERMKFIDNLPNYA